MPSSESKSKFKASPVSSAARDRIVAGARSHFFAEGFRGVTMDDLATELGMSKKTFYAHFASKAALVEAVLRAKFLQIEQEFEAISAKGGADFPLVLHEMLACMQRHVGEIQPAFVRDIRTEAPELFRLVEEKRADLIQRHFGTLFRDGRRAGMIRKDVPPWLIVEILLSATQAIMNPKRLNELELTPRQGYTAIINVILEGAMTAEGRKSL
jgi:AcrR family transcriptional regulator